MTTNACKTRRTNQFSTPEPIGFDVRLNITKFRGDAKIGGINSIPMLSQPHQEVVRLDIPMDETLRVNELQTEKKLVGEHQHGFERELAAAKVEKVFQTRAQEVKDQRVVVAFGLVSVDMWKTSLAGK